MEVSHGFQCVHSFEKHRAMVKQVIYNRQTKTYVSLDSKGLRLWDMKREHKNIRFKKDNFIQAIIYLETRQCYLAAAMDMSIKVYNHNLDKVSVSKELPDITIEERAILPVYDSTTDTLVTGSVHGAHIWSFGAAKGHQNTNSMHLTGSKCYQDPMESGSKELTLVPSQRAQSTKS